MTTFKKIEPVNVDDDGVDEELFFGESSTKLSEK
jgi:hypothetical protein